MSIIRVGPHETFRNVQAAIDWIVADDPPSNTNPAIIKVQAGFLVGHFTVPAYVTVCGEDWQGSVVNGRVTVLPAGGLATIKVLGQIELQVGPGAACGLTGIIAVSFAPDKPVVNVITKPGETSGVGALIWRSILGSHGPQVVRVNTDPGQGVIEHFFRDTQFELYGEASEAALRFDSTSLNNRTLGCTYQVKHAIAPGCVGIHTIGANLTSNGDLFEDGKWEVPDGEKYAIVDGGTGQFKGKLRLVNPMGNIKPSQHVQTLNGGTFTVV